MVSIHLVLGFEADPELVSLRKLDGVIRLLTGRSPRFVTVDPDGRFAYTANEGSKDVSGFAIDRETGALRAGSPAPNWKARA